MGARCGAARQSVSVLPVQHNTHRSSPGTWQKVAALLPKDMFNASPLFYVYKSLTTVAFGAVGVLRVMYLQRYYVSAMFLGLCYQQRGWLAHDYAHHQVFTNRD